MIYSYLESRLGKIKAYSKDDLLTGLYFENHKPAVNFDAKYVETSFIFAELSRQLSEYLNGDRREFTINYQFPYGTEFQKKIWSTLTLIQFGQVETYSSISESISKPRAVRAVAAAIARNPLSIVVPCHRVIGKNHNISGYAGGVEVKKLLLNLEGCIVEIGGQGRNRTDASRICSPRHYHFAT